jgi:hypothetical protein
METKQTPQTVTYKCESCGKHATIPSDKAAPTCCNKSMKQSK